MSIILDVPIFRILIVINSDPQSFAFIDDPDKLMLLRKLIPSLSSENFKVRIVSMQKAGALNRMNRLLKVSMFWPVPCRGQYLLLVNGSCLHYVLTRCGLVREGQVVIGQ